MEPILTDTLRFRLARIIAQRNAYRQQRDGLADAIAAYLERRRAEAGSIDPDLLSAYEYVMQSTLRGE
jgi:hypothetical protein